MKNIIPIVVFGLIAFLFIRGCGSDDSSFQTSPVDDMVKSMAQEQNYSIILYDMQSQNEKYYHQYLTLIEKTDTVLVDSTDWKEVSDEFFEKHIENMGMEIASKKDGKLTKIASPAGYNHYVGNTRYGRWNNRGGYSFWEFYGQYAFMNSMFNIMTYPVRRSYYDEYYGGYYGRRVYYGPGGSYYGTKTYTSTPRGQKSSWGSKPSTFRQNVRSSVSRSASASRTSRSSSRYSGSSSSSFRGRSSSGFGK